MRRVLENKLTSGRIVNILLKIVIFISITLFRSSFSSEAGRQTLLSTEKPVKESEEGLSVILAMHNNWACQKMSFDPEKTIEENKEKMKLCLAYQKLATRKIISLLRTPEYLRVVKDFKAAHNNSSDINELYKYQQEETTLKD